MNNDINCVYCDKELVEKSGGEEGIYPLRVRSLDLNDELGQISHIFSDKTGTLTSNYMNFRKLSVNGVVYGRGSTAIGMARRRRLGLETAELEELMKQQASQPKEVAHVDFIPGSETHPGRELRGPKSDLNGSGAKEKPAQAEALRLFMLNCCLNHTVVLEAVQDKHTGKIKHQLSASSPDEEAFVLAAKYFGYEFVNRQKDVAIIKVHGVEQRYRIVVIVPYSSARQMMSVVVEDLQPGIDQSKRFMLFSKGSDVRMFKLNVTETKASTNGEGMWLPPAMAAQTGGPAAVMASQRALINTTKAQLMEMAEDGLRTLCFSYRPLNEDFLKPWLERYETHLSDIQQKRLKDSKLPNKIDDTAAEMEKDLLFQGATANEDKLQEQVPETIALLGQAGIKIYMCTGDKQETAINIAFACRMLTNEYVRVIITSEELLSDKILEDAAKKRKDKQEAEAAARGMNPNDYRELLKWQPPEPVDQVLDYNSRLKLRAYADVARAKQSKNQEFIRPRALVIDEPVMNMVWPSIPQMPKVTASTVKDVYKDTVNLIAKVQALQLALAVEKGKADQYWFYDDSFTWREGESEDALKNCDRAALAEDSEEKVRIASILKNAHLPDLLRLDGTGYKHLTDGLNTILEVQKRIKAIEDEQQQQQDSSAIGIASTSAGGSAVSKDELEALHKQAERLASDLGPQIDAAYKAAKACYIACGHSMQKDLLVIAESCRAVVCCRCRPDQKKRMLELIRYNVSTSRCLAVGDGANDVDMIQAANVGVGIVGPEGVQAANASDYATGRFRFLQRLLLVHGRWNYNRMAMLVSYMFFKNVLYAIVQYLYTIIAAWSGQKFYVEAASQTFNLIFTGLPILVAAVYDQDVSALSALTFPYLYSDGLFRRRLNLSVLSWWLTTSVYEAALIFVFTYFGVQWSSMDGSSPYVFEFGSWAFTALVVVVNVRLAFNVTRHTWLFDIAWLGSAAIWFPALIFFSHVQSLSDNTTGMIPYLFGSGAFWLWLLVTVVATQTHNFIFSYCRRLYAPDYRDLVQEYEILMSKATEDPKKGRGCYKSCLTCGMRRDTVSKNKSAEQLLAIIEGIYPSASKLLKAGEDPAVVVAKELTAGNGGGDDDVASVASPASSVATASAGAGASAGGVTSPPPGISSHLSPNAESPLLANALGRVSNTPSSTATGTSGAAPGAPGATIKLVTPVSGSNPADFDVDFGPDLQSLDDPMYSASAFRLICCRCRRPNAATTTWRDSLRLPVKEDQAEELIEWPINQQMRISLQMRRRQLYEEAKQSRGVVEHPEVSLRKVKLDLLRARLSAVVEHGRSTASENDEAMAAAAVAEATAVGSQKRPSGVTTSPTASPAAATAVPILVAESPAASPEKAAAAPTPAPPMPIAAGIATAAAAGVGGGAAVGIAGAAGTTTGPITVAAAAREQTPSWALLQDIARVHRQYHERKKGSVTDFSVDDRSSAKMGEAISSVGRRINSMGRRFSSRRLTGTGAGPLATVPSFSASSFPPASSLQQQQALRAAGLPGALSTASSAVAETSSAALDAVRKAETSSGRPAGGAGGAEGSGGVEMVATPSNANAQRPSSAPHPVVPQENYLIAPHGQPGGSPGTARNETIGIGGAIRTSSSIASPNGVNIAAFGLSERVMTDPAFVSDRRASGLDLTASASAGEGGSGGNSSGGTTN
jgi:magnesium-transporting ATPase (P-type)